MQSAETLINLQKLLALLDPSLHLGEMLTNVARQLVEMFEVDHSGVLFFGYDDIEGEVVAEYPAQGALGLKLSLFDYPLVDQLKVEQKPIPVLDAQHDPIMGNVRLTMQVLGIKSILIIPLVVKDRLIGGLGLDVIHESRCFSQDELELCEVIGKQIAVAVDYARTLAAVEESQRQAQTLREVNRVLSETLNLDEILPLILEQLEKVVSSDGSSIYLLVEGGIQVKAWRGVYSPYKAQVVIPVEDLWGIAEVVKHKSVVSVLDTANHPQWRVLTDSPIKSWLGIPLVVRSELVGILNIDGYDSYQFNEADISLARAFARQAALAIHNARLYGQAERRAELLASVQEIGLNIVASLELEEVLRTISINVLELLDADHVRIFLYDRVEDKFTRAAALDRAGDFGVARMEELPPRREGLTATVVRTGQYLAVADTSLHPLYLEHQAFSKDFRAIIGIPLKKRGEVLGVFSIFYKQPHQFTADEIDLLHLLATQSAVAVENARLYEFQVKQIEQELDIARQIQRGFLPTRTPDFPGWTLAAICKPARETGGDFLDFVMRPDGGLGLVVGDVSGKSIPAAMLMAAAQSFTSAKGSDHRSPAKVLQETNRLLYEDVPQGSFVAVSYALLEPNGGQVWLSNGGQLAPFLVPANDAPIQLIETSGPRFPLGILPDIAYHELELTVAPGDTLVFHTDGLIESRDRTGKMLGFEGVVAILESLRGQSPQAILDALLAAGDEITEGVGSHDDVTLVVAQWGPG
jgi:serine phosphatase RsbU (regulator of sigma subunit)